MEKNKMNEANVPVNPCISLKPCPFCGCTDIKRYKNGNTHFLYCDDCETIYDMSCFGIWSWSAHHPAGLSLFQLYFFLFLTDVVGAGGENFFCDGLPCTNICDPKIANFQSCPNGMSSYPLGTQLCYDQSKWLALLRSIEDAKIIRSWTAGETQRVMHEDGFLFFGSLILIL
jgi:hypothetical protein